MKKNEKPYWLVVYGPDSRHLNDCCPSKDGGPVFNTLKEAREAYDGLTTAAGFEAKRLIRCVDSPKVQRDTVMEVVV